ncbi:MAG: DUF4145 domain-containing protein [Rhodoferax sp.]|nr:DUF4145 domain-containing protein [Rhodoferax sp.]
MPTLSGTFNLARCPQCSVAWPTLNLKWQSATNDSSGGRPRHWALYVCSTCGGVITAWGNGAEKEAQDHFPKGATVSDEIPERPRTFLAQAQESLHAPAGAVMLAASAVDSMLKNRGLTEGSLYSRIEQAATKNLITTDMTKWAHAVRLDANDQRHADEAATLPTNADAQRSIDFAIALAEILFVLPARVERGLKDSG